jgi:hypothetical protein
MANINTKVRLNTKRLKVYDSKVQKVYQRALNTVMDDLVRTSSESAPHDEGVLEKSWSKGIEYDKHEAVGVVSYSVKKSSGKGNYNYALRMHEDDSYNLGEKSLQKTGGTGMSGKTYKVGTGYLGDVLEGEKLAYTKYMDKKIKKFSKDF